MADQFQFASTNSTMKEKAQEKYAQVREGVLGRGSPTLSTFSMYSQHLNMAPNLCTQRERLLNTLDRLVGSQRAQKLAPNDSRWLPTTPKY